MNEERYFSSEQMAELKQYEPQFKTMLESQYARGVGINDIVKMWKATRSLYPSPVPLDKGCGNCLNDAILDCARIYRRTQEHLQSCQKSDLSHLSQIDKSKPVKKTAATKKRK